ncbi:HIT family protein [Solidesulfovibrio magneticus RS-1]|uniref:HIT family protein n=2 Tax=Solidesulfovibrio TaxID=2910984 RepID=C4XTH5_SOLM1|nr:HIT family protein [Solidesulfovibrio magneticus RS-1]
MNSGASAGQSVFYVYIHIGPKLFCNSQRILDDIF